MSPNIMIVEDEAITGLALEDSLTRLGHRVVASVTSGEEAVTIARQEHLDVVLMDIRLRGVMDGIAAAERIRKDVGVPCVYMTAYSDAETLRRAKVAEPYGYIVKPYNENELRAAIEIAIHNSAMERERRAAQQALLTRERTLQDIIDNSPTIIYLKDTQGRYTLVNRRFEVVFGVTKAAVRGKETIDALGAEGAAMLGSDDEQVLRDGVSSEREQEIKLGDVARRYVALRFPLKTPDGSVYGACGVLTDVTELLRVQERLRVTEARFRLVAEASIDLITLASMEGRFEFVSPSCRRLLGYEPAELVGTTTLALVHPDDVESAQQVRSAARTSEDAPPFTVRLRRKDGSYVITEVVLKKVSTGSAPSSAMILAVTRDITERAQMEAEIKRVHALLQPGRETMA